MILCGMSVPALDCSVVDQLNEHGQPGLDIVFGVYDGGKCLCISIQM